MKNQNNYAYDLLERLAFPRFGGTEAEWKAAQLLQAEAAALGGAAELMPFDIPAYRIEKAAVTVTAPFTRKLDCVAWGFSGQLPQGGVDLSIRYIEMNSPVAFRGLDDLSGCAVLVTRLDTELYGELCKRHAAAILEVSGDKWYQADADLLPTELRPRYQKLGLIPTFTLRASDAIAMMRDVAETVHLELRQESYTATSHNVVATVEGTGATDEWLAVTAHYDSMSITPGAWDNASGAAVVMDLYRYFLQNPPSRTIRFIWCGSEEQGCLGSRAYAARNAPLLSSCRMCVNFDMCGSVLGDNCIDLVGPDSLTQWVNALCEEAGFPAYVGAYVDASDEWPFSHRGVPAICPSRGHWTAQEYHTRHDTVDTVSAEKLREMAEFSALLLGRLANAPEFPIPREVPQEMQEQLNGWYGPAEG